MRGGGRERERQVQREGERQAERERERERERSLIIYIHSRRQHISIWFAVQETLVVRIAACATSAWHQRRLPLARDNIAHALEHACLRVISGRHADQKEEGSGDDGTRQGC